MVVLDILGSIEIGTALGGERERGSHYGMKLFLIHRTLILLLRSCAVIRVQQSRQIIIPIHIHGGPPLSDKT